MSQPLMPKATAVWMVDNTTLTFEQIAEFCGLHVLEVQAIADGEVALNIVPQNPIVNGELTKEEITRCEQKEGSRLIPAKSDLPQPKSRSKGPRYTPVAKRARKPDAIAYLLKQYPVLTDSQITRLVGTTKPTISQVRDRTHPNMSGISPESPVSLGFCKADELERAVKRSERAAEKAKKEEAKNNPTVEEKIAEDNLLEEQEIAEASDENAENSDEDQEIKAEASSF